jgi:dTDP-4-amino-4,6-dideoxygalactose transaminase
MANFIAIILEFILINLLLKIHVPHSVFALTFFLTLFFTTATRFSYRYIRRMKNTQLFSKKSRLPKKRLMFVGGGDACNIVLTEIMNNQRDLYKPVVIIDDNPDKNNQRIHGIPILYGSNRIVEIALNDKIDEIIITMPSAGNKRIKEIENICKKTSCAIKTIPSVADVISGKISYRLVREVNLTEQTQEKIYLASPHMSKEGYEIQFIQEAFDTNWIAPLGKNVTEFEKELADKVGSTNAVALFSGTGAIHMALKAVNVGKGDIVLCQSLTFSATANPIIYQDATPVFIDSDLDSWNMDPNLLGRALEKYPNAKAVIVVHLYGLAAKMDEILEICNRYNVPLIEDAAESLGTTYKGRQTGTFGQFGIYSFNGNKIITTSGGGMLISDDKEKIHKVYSWSTQSRDPARHYQHSELGFNYRMSNIIAGIGRGQLKVLDNRIRMKTHIFDFYKEELSHLEGLQMMPVNDWNVPNFWLSCIILTGKIRPLDIMNALDKENIESRPIWKPMHLQPFFEKYDYIGNGASEYLFENGLCLPSDTKMTDMDLIRITTIIKGLWK